MRRPENLQKVVLLLADDLPDLCRADEAALRARIAQPASQDSSLVVALIPDIKTILWHHAREEFVASELFDKQPRVKGAIVNGGKGSRVWCIWTRTFVNEADGGTLNVLRLMIEGEEDLEPQSLAEDSPRASLQSTHQQRVIAAASVLRAAQLEAATWSMKDVQIWNPTPTAMMAIKHLGSSASLIHRDEESIASLRWHTPELAPGTIIKWVANEKYGWC